MKSPIRLQVLAISLVRKFRLADLEEYFQYGYANALLHSEEGDGQAD